LQQLGDFGGFLIRHQNLHLSFPQTVTLLQPLSLLPKASVFQKPLSKPLLSILKLQLPVRNNQSFFEQDLRTQIACWDWV